MGISNKLSCEAGASPTTTTPTGFLVRGFEALFPHPGSLGCSVFLPPQLFLPVYPHANVGPPGPSAATLPLPASHRLARSSPPATALLQVLSTLAAISAPPTGLDECFIFNSSVVGLPYSSIFWQFWLFLVFKFVVVLLLVAQRGKVHLPMPTSWLGVLKQVYL